jgi:ABC-type nitrate/sulfonate/bicarbonate transport system permease component
MDSPPIFAGLMLVSLFGVILFGIVAMLEKLFMPWQFRPKGED